MEYRLKQFDDILYNSENENSHHRQLCCENRHSHIGVRNIICTAFLEGRYQDTPREKV
jgi:hypothetical protein